MWPCRNTASTPTKKIQFYTILLSQSRVIKQNLTEDRAQNTTLEVSSIPGIMFLNFIQSADLMKTPEQKNEGFFIRF